MRRVLYFVFAVLIGTVLVQADHFPPSKVASGVPEHVLSGVNVYEDNIRGVIEHLGKPNRITSSTNPDYPSGSGERSYEWNRGGIRLRVGTEFRTNASTSKAVESAPMIVDVWGDRADTLGTTGRGLSLGDDLSAVRRIYGPRFQKYPRSIKLQWKDETTLSIDLSKTGRITHMQLVAAME